MKTLETIDTYIFTRNILPKSFLVGSSRLVHLLRRILRRFGEVCLGDLEVVPRRNGDAVPDPGRRNMNRPAVGQFSLTRTAQVLPQLWPRL
ncbi:MAG: hypothetical protein ACIAXF_05035 [Phycisphaerales bacterium JB063]